MGSTTSTTATTDQTPAGWVDDDPAPLAATFPPSNVPDMTKDDRDKALREVYSEAQKALREMHRDEFNQLRVKLAADRGITWEPPQTAVDRAEAQVKALIEANPELADRLGLTAP